MPYGWIHFLTNLKNVNFLLNFDFAYFVYSHQGGGITSEHWVTYICLSVCRCGCLLWDTDLSICLICLSVCLSDLSIWFVCLSVRPSDLSVCLICLSIWFVCLSVVCLICLSVCRCGCLLWDDHHVWGPLPRDLEVCHRNQR